MRLLVVGKLNGQLSNAVKMAMTAGAKVSHVETIEAAPTPRRLATRSARAPRNSSRCRRTPR